MRIVPKRPLLLSSQEISDVLSALQSISTRWPAGPAQRALQLRDRIFLDLFGNEKTNRLETAR